MDLSGVYTSSSSSRSPSRPPRGAEINARLKCVAELSSHECLVAVVDVEQLLAHCSEELVLVELDTEEKVSREEKVATDTRVVGAADSPWVPGAGGGPPPAAGEAILDVLSCGRRYLTKGCVLATTAMVGACAMVGMVLANNHALTVTRVFVLILAVALTIFCCVLSEWTKN